MGKPGSHLTERFKVIRFEYCGGMVWQSAKSHETAAVMAAEIGDDEAALADVVPTMRLLFEKAHAGKLEKAAEVIKSASFAFGLWCSMFTELREELHGVTRPAPAATRRFDGPSLPRLD